MKNVSALLFGLIPLASHGTCLDAPEVAETHPVSDAIDERHLDDMAIARAGDMLRHLLKGKADDAGNDVGKRFVAQWVNCSSGGWRNC